MKVEKNAGFALLQSAVVSKIKMAESSGKVDFSKVLKMVDDMVALLKKEQKDDLESRDWCTGEFDKSSDEKKDTEAKVASLDSTIAEVRDSIASLAQEIGNTKQKIADLDTSVAEAGAQRQAEHSEFEAQQQLNTAAVQLIFKAKNRLQKFYNPGQYVAPAAREMTREEQILQGAGQDVELTAQPQMIAGTTQTVFIQEHSFSAVEAEVEPPVSPKTGSYKSSGQKGSSVMALMDMLTKEVETDMQEAEHGEKTASRDYEALIADAQETKAQDTKTVITSEASKADLEAQLDEAKNGHSLASDQLSQVKTYIGELHGSCDFITANFDARKEARTNEIDGLGNAKAVLSGANYSF
jgi:chromosome segregation ATPase